ncbi:hypothetical protein Leryth_026167 [Lithospermum erythrorhizon]|uniref:Acetyltransferase n=1 Tax=Lithospermum erythrorhizon TaxID=34254 RepID=A0AAV3RIX2_LITER|nr:hypothetical protein Leryth_026167 [Lithospermum erythrorhizon]
MFLLSWVEIAQSKSQSSSSCVPPSFDRSMLSARKPPSFDLSVVNTYVPEITLSPSEDSHSNGMNLSHHQAENAISRIYYMKAGDITRLQSLANISNNKGCDEFRKKTKLEAFSAFLWKLIASWEHASEDKSCKMGIVVDGRGNLSSENEGRLWNLYIGNVLSIPFGEMEIEELKKKPINLVADSIQEFLKPAMSREHFLGLVDYVEAQRPKKLLAKIYATKAIKDEAAVVISSGLRFPIRMMDFGWGFPVFGSCYFSWKGKAGYVMPIPSARGNGDWIVYMHLLEKQFELIENCEDGILKPLTSDYLFKE